eukprot:4329847-Alexandrium_andersonii.AAC.1
MSECVCLCGLRARTYAEEGNTAQRVSASVARGPVRAPFLSTYRGHVGSRSRHAFQQSRLHERG